MSLGFRPLIEPTNQRFLANGKSWPLLRTPNGDTYSPLPLLIFSLLKHRQYEAKLPTRGHLRISPVSHDGERVDCVPLTGEKS